MQLWLDDLVMPLLIAMVSDGTGRNDSIAYTLHDTASIFATYLMIAAVTIAWIDWPE